MTKYKNQVLSEYYGNTNENNTVLVIYNSFRKRYEVMHDGVLIDSCLTEEIAQVAAEDYVNEKQL
tara:strand:+ start:426 stop:620 length:195 start_codon:yes stop_codon:yes gene_type:complete